MTPIDVVPEVRKPDAFVRRSDLLSGAPKLDLGQVLPRHRLRAENDESLPPRAGHRLHQRREQTWTKALTPVRWLHKDALDDHELRHLLANQRIAGVEPLEDVLITENRLGDLESFAAYLIEHVNDVTHPVEVDGVRSSARDDTTLRLPLVVVIEDVQRRVSGDLRDARRQLRPVHGVRYSDQWPRDLHNALNIREVHVKSRNNSRHTHPFNNGYAATASCRQYPGARACLLKP